MTTPYFSPDALNEIRNKVYASLAETFKVMFQLEVFASAEQVAPQSEKAVASHIEMNNTDTTAYLSVVVGDSLVNHICDLLEPGVDPHTPELVQEIVGEITNIVSNNLRTYLIENHSLSFDLSLPKPGAPKVDKDNAKDLQLHYRINIDDGLDLDFVYTDNKTV